MIPHGSTTPGWREALLTLKLLSMSNDPKSSVGRWEVTLELARRRAGHPPTPHPTLPKRPRRESYARLLTLATSAPL